jgi:uncharacterized protein YqeY
MLRDEIGAHMREAMKAREQARVVALRLLMTAVRNAEVEAGRPLSDEEVREVAAREARRRRESIEAFERGGRADLVAKETAELAALEPYLPAQLGPEELARLVEEAVREVGASSPRDLGAVMKVLMPRVRGRADGATVSRLVRERLEGSAGA